MSELDAFVGAPPEPPPPAPPEPATAAPVAAPVEPPPPPPPPAQASPKVEDDADHDDQPEPTDPVGSFKAYEAERRRRQDWKEKAIRAEAERDTLRRQIEEARAAPPPQPPQPLQEPPQPQIRFIDPTQDPIGFAAQVQELADQRAAQRMLNLTLNWSEAQLRREMGAEKVDALVAEFKKAAEADPSLFQKLYQQPDPYSWAARHVETMRMQREIGDDPAAYRARIEAEARARWEAEQQAAQPEPARGPVVGNMPRSLATTRSVASRSAPVWTGDLPLTDIVAQIHKR